MTTEDLDANLRAAQRRIARGTGPGALVAREQLARAAEEERREAAANRAGWCAGDIVASLDDPGRGRWLTVWGSYHTAPELYPQAWQAQASGQRGDSIAHVTEVAYPGVGRAYQVTPGTLADRSAPGPDLCADCGDRIEREDVPMPGASFAPAPWWHHMSEAAARACPGTRPVRPAGT